jgi:LacI family transcriptional regulator, gluconate utilization system Gnt-I transcriptional repressor
MKKNKLIATRPRMADVAHHAGVAAITVSRALRDPDSVSPDVRKRVSAAVKALGYVPNLAAGTLKSQRSQIVAAIVPTLRSSVFAETVQGLNDELRAQGYQLLLANSGYSTAAEETLVAALLGRQPEGIVLTGIQHTRKLRDLLSGISIPVVETWDLADDPIDMMVGFSNFEAARQITLALVDRGYRHIAFAGVPPESEPRSARRLAGYAKAVSERGLPEIVDSSIEVGLEMSQGGEALERLVARYPEIDAVFFANDPLAFGALQRCQRRGWAVPKRIAVAGFGDFEIARETIPALTTVRIPGYEIGRTAARMILERRDNGPPAATAVDLGFEIVIRDSA